MTKDDFNLRVQTIINTSQLSDIMSDLVELCHSIGIDFEDFVEYLDANVRRDLGTRLVSVGVIKQPEGYIQPELELF